MEPTTDFLATTTLEPPAPPAPLARKGRGGLVASVAATALVAGLVGGIVGAHVDGDSTAVSSSLDGTSSTSVQASSPRSYAAIAAKVLPSVVNIDVAGSGESDTGTGVVIRSDGYILTNNHVVAAAKDGGRIRVTFSDGSETSASITGTDPASDLAVIRVHRSNLKPAAFGDSGAVRVGDPVLAIGSPLGLSGSVTSGIVSALNRPVTTTTDTGNQFFGGGSSTTAVISAIQTDAAINPGNSGGPLVNAAGQVIGINSAIASLGSDFGGQSGNIGVGFAIPIDQARDVARQLIATGKASHPLLGVEIADVTTNSGANEVLVRGLQAGGPAAAAGIHKGDVITAIDGTSVDSTEALIAAVRTHQPGDDVRVTYERDGSRHTVTVTLANSTASAS